MSVGPGKDQVCVLLTELLARKSRPSSKTLPKKLSGSGDKKRVWAFKKNQFGFMAEFFYKEESNLSEGYRS